MPLLHTSNKELVFIFGFLYAEIKAKDSEKLLSDLTELYNIDWNTDHADQIYARMVLRWPGVYLAGRHAVACIVTPYGA